MEKHEIIENITGRTGGDIYLGVVGAVRTGKSTFIKKVIETLVVPNIEDEYEKKRTLDEIPQSAQGKTIMTTEPKFVPSNSAKIKIDNFTTNVRLVDCVGYIIPGCKGYEDENGPRLVKTPWYEENIPFEEAALIGTEKVIKDHSTIGIVVTTDGSIGEIERKNYEEVEEKVISELKEIGKPFIVIMNSIHPMTKETIDLTTNLKQKYNVPVININIEQMQERDMYDILKEALYEFPVTEVDVNMPEWIACLSQNHWLKKEFIEKIRESVIEIDKIKDIDNILNPFKQSENIENSYLSNVDTKTGTITINLDVSNELYNKVLNDMLGININSKKELLMLLQDYNEMKEEYGQIKTALKMVKTTGYGVASPTLSDMKLSTPEIIKQGNRYGVKLKAVAPSIHIVRIERKRTALPEIIGINTKKSIKLNMKYVWSCVLNRIKLNPIFILIKTSVPN